MSESEAHPGDPTRCCAVVLAHAKNAGIIDRITSSDLPDGELAILRKRMGSAFWSPTRLFKLASERNWPPLMFVRGRPPLVPPPCEQQFEPTPLNGADPTLHAFADVLLERAEPALHKVLRHKPKLSEFARINLIATFVLLLYSAAFVILTWRSAHTLPPWLLMLIPNYALAYIAVYFLCRCNWYIVPGGVVIRRANAGGTLRLRVFSPANALLVTNMRQVHIIARNSGEMFWANLSRFEIMILLAVWQSPIPAPDVSKLVDLQ